MFSQTNSLTLLKLFVCFWLTNWSIGSIFTGKKTRCHGTCVKNSKKSCPLWMAFFVYGFYIFYSYFRERVLANFVSRCETNKYKFTIVMEKSDIVGFVMEDINK